MKVANMTDTYAPLKSDTSIDEIVENFSLLEDWDDRYGYLIELGRDLSPLPEEALCEENKVQGCVSQVWVTGHADRSGSEPVLSFKGASDAHIVSGLVAIALTLFSNKTASEILSLDEQQTFTAIGLQDHLTPQRSNGLRAMVRRLKAMATAEMGTS